MAELSQRELAKMSNLSDTYMSQLERGMHEPSIRVLKSIARSLGIPVEQFIGFAAGVYEEPVGAPAGTEDAIRADARLTAEQRKALLGVLASFLSANRPPSDDPPLAS